jgi:LmbE family N-acetylglucosaminyl deacetylase
MARARRECAQTCRSSETRGERRRGTSIGEGSVRRRTRSESIKTIPLDRIERLLCLGAHGDDIEIGCGGAVRRILARNPRVAVDWVVFAADEMREAEARASAGKFLAGAGAARVEIHRFRESFFPYEGDRIKVRFEELKGRLSPDLILTHQRNDLHQDHRIVSELTWNTFRNHMILEYEIPKWDGDVGAPNFFVHLDEADCKFKVETILQSFASQRGKHWFREDLFRALMRIRGMESNAPSGLAEAFYARKICV